MRLRQILFVELLGGIGDLVMALPAIHALALSHPQAQVSVFTFRPGIDLLTSDPKIARLFPATRQDDANGTPLAKDELRQVLSSHDFDLVVCDVNYGGIDRLVEESPVRERVTRLWRQAGQNERIERVFLRNLLDLGYIAPEFAPKSAHGVANGAVPNSAHDSPQLALTQSELAWARAWYESNVGRGQSIMINPDAGVVVKRWAPEHFITVGKQLSTDERHQILVVAGERASLAREIAEGIGARARVLPRMPLRQLASLAALASLFISVDTGPAKIAAAVGTSTVALYGPTWSGRYGLPWPNINLQSPFQCHHLRPMNFTSQPCWYSGRCAQADKRSCTDDIAPHLVTEAAIKLLSAVAEVRTDWLSGMIGEDRQIPLRGYTKGS